ncbi:spermidine synthase [Caldicellulosiruptor bescii]|uniref:Polyamine aminopropyltransferase n=3 Tax=Caldicellulosiruptor bescii TaxID=31899 RepID=SPEE_CALBD|nr:RecName: Full=Polyamine aminopropyltransferase; AltName: Full=Putrescine aminopropyltransferase; Short=PAPT; AltName: Full=Spermidine synthase; Short=SPDS; Short=SPDSY [Caldicellulosiruptor bescii DSM 6725]PBC87828.1 spermidine synthase [Caldicellulosiruptor bescii]ACM60414.1 spermidine synthase [Caldicellulosiruptor bescii DSM 6725]PBC90760.1 spermidine synthase [Caldicellulosiruptor bescii]PBD03807.1 spermidine synthase [Caldicellulosiruptor bescii]PBD06558.1 spermidine synthase [Caldicel
MAEMELWFTEQQTPDLGFTCKITKTIYTAKTQYQDLAILETKQFGRMLVLDGAVQTTIADEFCYHELISHVPLFTHPNPKKVAVIGGGDGGVIREILKHDEVEKAYLIEIDREVIEASKKYLPEISCALDDERAEVIITDGIKFVSENKNMFDVIIVDSTDPVGPAVGLFQDSFYKAVFECLKEDGLFVAQTESPFYDQDLIKNVFHAVKSIFPITRLYLGFIPTYPSGLWSFTLGSKKYDPLEVDVSRIKRIDTKYYNPELHKALFALPTFVQEIIK